MNKIELENKINLLRKILILWYNVKYEIQVHDFGEYWFIGIDADFPMLTNLIKIERNFVSGINPSVDDMKTMNDYYKTCLISPRVRKFLHYDKKN